MTEKNLLQIALENRLSAGLPVRNLIESNFHESGLVPEPSVFSNAFSDYMVSRRYNPNPRGLPAARAAIADFYNNGGPVSHTSMSTDPNRVFLTASSSEAYSILFNAFCEPGDNVLIPHPSYPLFEDLISYAGLEPRFYPLREDQTWEPDTELIELISDSRTRFIVVISPNNPCGTTVSRKTLSRIATLCEEQNIMIISDEVFSEFLFVDDLVENDAMSEHSHRVDLPRAAEFGHRIPVFTINGISKMFASPDFKLSWIALHSPESDEQFPSAAEIADLLETRIDTYLNANSFSQFLLPRLFKDCSEFVRTMRDSVAIHRTQLIENRAILQDAGFRLVLPNGGIHFVLGLPKGTDDETLALRMLEEKGLYAHPGYLYGFEDDQPALVMTLLGKTDVWAASFNEFANFLSSL